MRHILVRAVVLTAIVSGTSLAYAFSTGPPATRTGARGFPGRNPEPACNICHGSGLGIPLNDPSGSLHILDVPTNYAPSQIYTLRVQIQHTWNPLPPDPIRWGFQLQAIREASGDHIGTWVLAPNTPPDTFKVLNGGLTTQWKNRKYIEHTRNNNSPVDPIGAIHQGELGPIEWHVKWQAPPGDSGKIYFFAAGNSANGDGLAILSGDYIFTTVESTTAGGSVGVPGSPAFFELRNALDPPNPNPMKICTDLSFTIVRGGIVDLSVFDLSGRRVRNLLHEFRQSGSHGSTWSGKNERGEWCRNGVYFVRLTAPDQHVVTQKLVLSR